MNIPTVVVAPPARHPMQPQKGWSSRVRPLIHNVIAARQRMVDEHRALSTQGSTEERAMHSEAMLTNFWIIVGLRILKTRVLNTEALRHAA